MISDWWGGSERWLDSEARRINAEFAETQRTLRRVGEPQEHRQECLCHTEERQKLEAEDLEVAFAGEDYGEEAAVWGEGVFADGEPVEEHAGFGFEDGDFGVRRVGAEFGDLEGDEVGGFFFDGAFEIET